VTCLPLTAAFKAFLGVAPFPDGKFPTVQTAPEASQDVTWLPAGVDFIQPDGYPVPPEGQYAIQFLVGIASSLFSVVDMYMNIHAAHIMKDDDDHDYTCFLVGVAIFDFLWFGVGDLPIFWGVEKDSDSHNMLWWGEYIPKTLIYLGDLYVCVIGPVCGAGGKIGEHLIGALGGNNFGTFFITAAAITEVGCSIALLTGSDHNPIDKYWAGTQITGLVPSLTAPIRMRYYPSDHSRWGISLMQNPKVFSVKSAVDISCDVGAGSAWAFVAGKQEQLATEQSFRPLLSPTTLPAATIGKAYATPTNSPVVLYVAKEGFADWSPIGWAVDPGSPLPDGLSITPLGPDNTGLGISGMPSSSVVAQTYKVTIWVCNSYDPNNLVKQDFQLVVNAAPPSVS
jgi:hypothetical protein